jgi:hypothetical protein
VSQKQAFHSVVAHIIYFGNLWFIAYLACLLTLLASIQGLVIPNFTLAVPANFTLHAVPKHIVW